MFKTEQDAQNWVAVARLGSSLGGAEKYLSGLRRYLQAWIYDIDEELATRNHQRMHRTARLDIRA
jgi:membrane protein YqaA with SNARE-associated domain